MSDLTQTPIIDSAGVPHKTTRTQWRSVHWKSRPKDRGTERQFRFTRALLCTLLGVKSENTITNHVQALINSGVIEVTKNLVTLKIPSQSGVQETTLYDLKVFNYLSRDIEACLYGAPECAQRARIYDALKEKGVVCATPFFNDH